MKIAIYILELLLFIIGVQGTIMSKNIVKKLISLNISQAAIILLYITIGYVSGSVSPVLRETTEAIYANPLTQVLMLTAVVVGLATTCLGLAISIQINKCFKTLDTEKLNLQYKNLK